GGGLSAARRTETSDCKRERYDPDHAKDTRLRHHAPSSPVAPLPIRARRHADRDVNRTSVTEVAGIIEDAARWLSVRICRVVFLPFPPARHHFIADLGPGFLRGPAGVAPVLFVISCAGGHATPESDLDLAVLVTPPLAAERCRQLEMAWLSFG